MPTKDSPLHKKREEFIREMFEEILDVPDYSDLKSNTFNVIARLGLQLKAKEEKLLEDNDWSNPECRNNIIEKIKEFLDTHIK